MRLPIAIATLVAMLFAGPLQGAWEIDERSLPPGLPKDRALRMLEQADAASAAADRRALQAFEERGRRMEQAAQRYQAQLRRAIDADPQLRAQAQQLEARLEALRNGGEPSPQQLESLAQDARTFAAQASARAGIDQEAMQRDLRAALEGPVRPRGAGQETITFSEDGAIVIEHAVEPEPEPGVTSRSVNTITLTAPFPASELDSKLPGRSSASTIAGSYRTSVSMHIGGSGINRSGLVHFLTIPPNTTNLRIVAQLPGTAFFGFLDALWGGAGHKLRSHIEVTDGRSLLCRREFIHLDHWWVGPGLIRKSGQDHVALDCTPSTLPAAGTDVAIRFIGQISSYSWGYAGSAADIFAKPLDIRIEVTTSNRVRSW